MNIILASQSPRRRELLARLPLKFNLASCDIDESVLANEVPQDYLVRMVQNKASAYVQFFNESTFNADANNKLVSDSDNKSDTQLYKSASDSRISHDCSKTLIITSDTIGVMPNLQDILIKPIDKADAIRMWQAMSGQSHFVWTAVKATVIEHSTSDTIIVWEEHIIEKTEVEFIALTIDDMNWYWNTGEPVDKAGAYAIQGLASAWVNRINGSYSNVVGLPLAQTKQLIDRAMKQR